MIGGIDPIFSMAVFKSFYAKYEKSFFQWQSLTLFMFPSITCYTAFGSFKDIEIKGQKIKFASRQIMTCKTV